MFTRLTFNGLAARCSACIPVGEPANAATKSAYSDALRRVCFELYSRNRVLTDLPSLNPPFLQIPVVRTVLISFAFPTHDHFDCSAPYLRPIGSEIPWNRIGIPLIGINCQSE